MNDDRVTGLLTSTHMLCRVIAYHGMNSRLTEVTLYLNYKVLLIFNT